MKALVFKPRFWKDDVTAARIRGLLKKAKVLEKVYRVPTDYTVYKWTGNTFVWKADYIYYVKDMNPIKKAIIELKICKIMDESGSGFDRAGWLDNYDDDIRELIKKNREE